MILLNRSSLSFFRKSGNSESPDQKLPALFFMNYSDYFLPNSVLKKAAAKRVAAAFDTASENYFKQYMIKKDKINYPEVYSLFPARKKWFRPRPHGSRASFVRQPLQVSLVRTVKSMIWFSPLLNAATNRSFFQMCLLFFKGNTARWEWKLKFLFLRIYFFSNFPLFFRFRYSFKALPKEPDSKQYRLICSSKSFVQTTLVGLVANYIRDFIDPVLSNGVYAFRPKSKLGSAPNHHDAFEKIHSFVLKSNSESKDVFAAECDIKKFFDSVRHSEVLAKFEQIILEAESKNGNTFSDEARIIFNKFIKSYSFPKARAKALGSKSADSIPWIEDSNCFKQSIERDKKYIGVPQGSALSCIVANIILHEVDAKIENILGKNGIYLRYCDDMIILSNNKNDVDVALNVYLTYLDQTGLPYHLPVDYGSKSYDGNLFWNKSKSKSTYKLGKNEIPWISFVGYHIRYDGKVRIRLKSIKKEFEQQKNVIKAVFKKIRISKKLFKPLEAVSMSLHRRIISRSVGKDQNKLHDPNFVPKLCWIGGFQGASSKNKIRRWQRELDRHRFKKISAFRSQIKSLIKKGEIQTDLKKWNQKQSEIPVGRKKISVPAGRLFSYDRL